MISPQFPQNDAGSVGAVRFGWNWPARTASSRLHAVASLILQGCQAV
jgi:hypothetical protein